MATNLHHHVAAAIRAARKAKGLTQEQLAAQIERTPESLSNIERGHALPSLETLMLIGSALDLQPGSFLPETGELPDRAPQAIRLEQEIAQVVSKMDTAMLQVALKQLAALAELGTKRTS